MKALRAKLYSIKLEEETSKRYNQRKIQVSLATCGVSTQLCTGKGDSDMSINLGRCLSSRLVPEAGRKRFGRIILPRTASQTTGSAWRCTMSRASSWVKTCWRRWTRPCRSSPTRKLSWNCCLKTPRIGHDAWRDHRTFYWPYGSRVFAIFYQRTIIWRFISVLHHWDLIHYSTAKKCQKILIVIHSFIHSCFMQYRRLFYNNAHAEDQT